MPQYLGRLPAASARTKGWCRLFMTSLETCSSFQSRWQTPQEVDGVPISDSRKNGLPSLSSCEQLVVIAAIPGMASRNGELRAKLG